MKNIAMTAAVAFAVVALDKFLGLSAAVTGTMPNAKKPATK